MQVCSGVTSMTTSSPHYPIFCVSNFCLYQVPLAASECPEWRWEPGHEAEPRPAARPDANPTLSIPFTTAFSSINRFPLSAFHSHKRCWKSITWRQEATQAHTANCVDRGHSATPARARGTHCTSLIRNSAATRWELGC